MTASVKSSSLSVVQGKTVTVRSVVANVTIGKQARINSMALNVVIAPPSGIRLRGHTLSVVTEAPPVVEKTRDPRSFDYSGARQSVTVPAGVDEIEFGLWGASGGAGVGFSPANTLMTAGGAFAGGSLTVAEGDVIEVDVGERGRGAVSGSEVGGSGGWPDGMDGSFDCPHDAEAGGGGGSTVLYVNGVEMARAPGSPGTGGFPAYGNAPVYGSVIPASSATAHPSVVNPVLVVSPNQSAAENSRKPDPETTTGWGVSNPAEGGNPRSGEHGFAEVVLLTP